MLSIENRLPAPPPPSSHLLSKVGWSMVFILGLLAAFLTIRYFTLTSTVKLLSTDAELSRIEVQSLHQQLEVERILAARQITDSATIAAPPEPLLLARLTSPESSDTRLSTIIAWRPASQTGVFYAEQLPPPTADKEYRLWIETNGHSPISAGEIKVATTGPTQVEFRTTDTIGQPTRFTITCESKDNTTPSAVIIVLTGAP
jgi:Anti-sigma-K factor rskA